jgi:hypothetical protein
MNLSVNTKLEQEMKVHDVSGCSIPSSSTQASAHLPKIVNNQLEDEEMKEDDSDVSPLSSQKQQISSFGVGSRGFRSNQMTHNRCMSQIAAKDSFLNQTGP